MVEKQTRKANSLNQIDLKMPLAIILKRLKCYIYRKREKLKRKLDKLKKEEEIYTRNSSI